ncbi:OmpA family protein [Vreelandella venusta]
MGIKSKSTAFLSMMGMLVTSIGLAGAQEFTDVSADLTALEGVFVRDGVFIPVPDIRRVEQRSTDLNKSDVGGLLGIPNDLESTPQDNNWLYNINLPLTANDYLVCQYQVSFSQDIVVSTEWRRPQCVQRYMELTEPQEYSLSADLLFAFDSASISPAGGDAIRQIASEIRQYFESPTISILGYTDRIGAFNYNMQLSERRAETVATALINSGVDSRWITHEGLGASEPIVWCDDVVGEALKSCLAPNRRVVISLYEQF